MPELAEMFLLFQTIHIDASGELNGLQDQMRHIDQYIQDQFIHYYPYLYVCHAKFLTSLSQ